MLRIVTKCTRCCDRFYNFWGDEVTVTTFATPVDKSRALKLGDKFPYFLGDSALYLGITMNDWLFHTKVLLVACYLNHTPFAFPSRPLRPLQ